MDLGHQMTNRKLEKLERKIAKVYREARDELQETIDAYFESFQKRDEEMKALIGTVQNGREWTEQDYKQWRLNQIARGERFEALRDEIARRMTKANETAIAYVNDETPGIYALNRNYAAYAIEQVAGDVGFTLWDESTVRLLIAEDPGLMPYYPKKKAVKRGIDLAWGKKQITANVTSGILQGKSIGKIANGLQRAIPEMNRTSAVRAARTAVTGAQNAGRMDSYHAAEEMGIKLKKEWMATLDSRTRHAHALLDGQRADVDKPFRVEGQEIRFPGDPTAYPSLVYNCRCTLIAAVDGVDTSDAQRRGRDLETGQSVVIENMTYAEWENSKRQQAITLETETILRYNETVKSYTNIDVGAVLSAAKAGTRNKGVYVDATRKRKRNLEKSIASHTAQVEEHAKKIQYPEEYDAGWAEKDERQKQGLIRKWEKDLRRNAEQAEIEIEVWKERFGNE